MVKPLASKARTEKVYPPGLNPTTPADILNYAKSGISISFMKL